ncbi:MAG: hypothetical protein AAGD96_08445 [Chloroflexota bacterium]
MISSICSLKALSLVLSGGVLITSTSEVGVPAEALSVSGSADGGSIELFSEVESRELQPIITNIIKRARIDCWLKNLWAIKRYLQLIVTCCVHYKEKQAKSFWISSFKSNSWLKPKLSVFRKNLLGSHSSSAIVCVQKTFQVLKT